MLKASVDIICYFAKLLVYYDLSRNTIVVNTTIYIYQQSEAFDPLKASKMQLFEYH